MVSAAEKTAAAEAADPKANEKTVASGKVVKYIGLADVREIDHAAWDNVGSDNKKIVWNKSNRWMVPVDEFDDMALIYCDEDDAEFVIMDAPLDRIRALREGIRS